MYGMEREELLMSSLGKILVVLLIVGSITWSYFTIKDIWKEDDVEDGEIILPSDIAQMGDDETGNNADVQDEINNIVELEMGGEKFESKIGNPIGKIVEGGEINISVANIYSEADENSEVLDTINKYETVISQAFPNGWSRVKSGTLSGWMRSEHITLPEDSDTKVLGSVIGKTGFVNVTSLNVRASASSSSKRLDSLTENTEVTITNISDDGSWYQIKWQSLEGWVASEYITIK